MLTGLMPEVLVPRADAASITVLENLVAVVTSPEFADNVVAADRDGHMALDNVAALRRIGITALPADPAFGEGGAPVSLLVDVMEVLGRFDASTAVAMNMHWSGVRALSRMPTFARRDEALAAVLAGTGALCGAFSNPSGEIDSRKARLSCRIEGDDLVLNGRAGFGSMSDAATHAVLGGLVENSDPDDPLLAMTVGRIGETGLIKHDNWSAMGMRGTGSNDIECRDLRIPVADCLVLPRSQMVQSRATESAVVAFGIAAIWVGLCQTALDFTVEHVKGRYGYMAQGTFNDSRDQFRADQAWAQIGIGGMDHWHGTGRDLLRSIVLRLDAGEDVPPRDLVRPLFHLRRMVEEVSMGAMKVCGAHGYVTAQKLERVFRDLLGGVVMAWKTDQLQQTLGVGALGREIAFTGPAGS
jgi:alkylation response protein AidB-like acyl-CoA dehydrogenase